jgi:hypothetical protein
LQLVNLKNLHVSHERDVIAWIFQVWQSQWLTLLLDLLRIQSSKTTGDS